MEVALVWALAERSGYYCAADRRCWPCRGNLSVDGRVSLALGVELALMVATPVSTWESGAVGWVFGASLDASRSAGAGVEVMGGPHPAVACA